MKTFLLDASLFKISNCLQQVDFIHNKGLYTDEGSFRMDYGTAIHKFKQAYDSKKPLIECYKQGLEWYFKKCPTVPDGDFRTIDHLQQTMVLYPTIFPRDTDTWVTEKSPSGDYCCELSFSFPLSLDFLRLKLSEHVRGFNGWNGNRRENIFKDYEWVFCGTIDKKAKNTSTNDRASWDTKVTSLWRQDAFLAGFELDPQLLFYSYVQRIIGMENEWLPAGIEACFIKNPTFKHRDPSSKKLVENKTFTGAEFKRSQLYYFNDEQMFNFEGWLFRKIWDIYVSEEQKKYYQNNNCCKTVFGMCDFFPLCRIKEEKRNEILTEGRMYKTRKYEPTKFQE